MGRVFGVVVVVAVCVSSSFSPAATPAHIREAIEKSKSWLYSAQSTDRTWEEEFSGHGDQKTGQTALAVYALLSAGESHQDPRLAAAVDYLKKTPTTGVYALGLRCQVWLALPQTPEIRRAMTTDAKVLISSMQRTGDAKGFYDYNPIGRKSIYSHSRAQYGVLGLWAAAQAGVPVPKDYWALVEKAWIDHQDPSGGWAYYAKPRSGFPITPGMTAVGVATLFITQDYLHASKGLSGGGNIRNPAIDRGMKWMTDNFAQVAGDEKYPRAYPFATLYAVERIGVASGIRYFGDVDWYQKGAEFLVRQQQSNGSYSAEFNSKVASTSFALLFLSRGAAPVFMSKLDFSTATFNGKEGIWNQRPRDVANAARWVGRQMERELNWQIVTLDSPVEDWQDAPLLYLAGSQMLALKPEHEAKIKQFIEQGGIVLGNADNASKSFAEGFQALGKRLFPGYAFAPLPEAHPIYSNQQFHRSSWARKPAVLSMSNGVRELMLILPDLDAGRWWQMQSPTTRQEAFELAANVFLYATDKQPRRRGEHHLVMPDEAVSPTRSIRLARIEYAGNWDPEPGGWRRLRAVLRNEQKIEFVFEPVKLASNALDGFAVAHLTGTGGFELDPAGRDELKRFVGSGGTLLIDAAGGSTDFTTAAEKELTAIWPEAAVELAEPIAPDAPLHRDLEKVGYRASARSKLGQLSVPQLRGIRIGDRLGVFYSREDLSAGLVGQSVDGIVGYDPQTATSLVSRMILAAQP